MESSNNRCLLLVWAVVFMLGNCMEISRETTSSIPSGPTCGYRPRIDDPNKIAGGQNSNRGSEPWQANLFIDISPEKDEYGRSIVHHCGGTIINEYWILTAAHCWEEILEVNVISGENEKTVKQIPINESSYFVVVGDYNQWEYEQGEDKFDRLEFIRHEDFSLKTLVNDIALLKILPKDGRGIKFTDYVQPACLPNAETPYTPGEECIISGWGDTDKDDNVEVEASILQTAVVPIVENEVCTRLLPTIDPVSMMCAGYAEGGIDTCHKDSGGPLVCHIDGAYTVLGVTSWGVGCGRPNLPGVYARVREFLPWIYDHIQGYSGDENQMEIPRRF